MDEYLFITMAKLKADKLQLEREQRAAAAFADPAETPDQSTSRAARRSPQLSLFPREPYWREQS